MYLKLSYVDENEVTKMIEWLKGLYGKGMQASWGEKHDYLGMDDDFSKVGEIRVTMINYLKEVISEFPKQINGSVTSPVADHLFDV